MDLYLTVSETTVLWPYDVLWKVKNYGAEAAAVPGGLRGRAISGTESALDVEIVPVRSTSG